MRNALNVVADLVDRVEVGEVVVDGASFERDDEGFDVSLSVHIPGGVTEAVSRAEGPSDTDESAVPVDARPTAADADPPAEPARRTPSEAFGATAVRVGATLGEEIAGEDSPTTRQDGGTPAKPASGSSSVDGYVCRVDGCEETFETEHGMKIHATKAHREADGSGPSPHRDPERLRAVYDRHDTFEAMTAALGVDVTAQTVRRSMISLGIHDPGDAETVNGADNDEDQATASDRGDGDGRSADQDAPATDGDATVDAGQDELDPEEAPEVSGSRGAPGEPDPARPDPEAVAAALPEAVAPEVLVTAVRDASTVFQVQRAMGIEREAVQTLLAELGLLELVTGRVGSESDREMSSAEIEHRIVERAGDGEDAPGAAIEAE